MERKNDSYLKFHLINIAYNEVYISIAKLFIMSSALTYIFFNLSTNISIFYWYISALIVYGIKIVDANYYKKHKNEHSYKYWFWRFFILTSGVVAIWNTFIFNFFPINLEYQIILIFILIMITGCGATALASYRKFMIPFQIGMLYPMAIMLYMQGGYSYTLVLIYMVYVSITGNKIHTTILEAYRHQLKAEENASIMEVQREALREINTTLEQKVAERTHDIDLKSSQISLLLDNSGEAFFSYNSEMIIDSIYSKAFIEFVGHEPSGYKIDELLFHDSLLQQRFRECSIDALNEHDPERSDLFLSLLPKEIEHDAHFFSARYLRVNEKIMVVLSDISDEKKLALERHQESLRLIMIESAIGNRGDFFANIEDFKHFISEGASRWKRQKPEPLYRLIHTFKGSFAQFGFYRIPKMLHIAESMLQDFLATSQIPNDTFLEELFQSPFENSLILDMKILVQLFGESFFEQGGVIVLSQDFASLLEHMAKKELSTQIQNEDLVHQLQYLSKLSSVSLKKILENYNPLIERIGENLEKVLNPIQISGDDILLPLNEYRFFLRSLGHMIRNSIDHGIETPEERVLLGKEVEGTISCFIKDNINSFELHICDDGSGINEIMLRSKAEEILGDTANNMTLQELIFCDGVSAKDETTEYSGRGIGMCAVYNEVIRLNGNIELETNPGKGMCIRINLPK